MSIKDTYLTINSKSESLFKDRGSKFHGYAYHVKNEDDVKAQLEALKKVHPSARHFCYAYKINPLDEYWRANDDGEPSSSAGKPILGQINSKNLTEVLVVVVRYFGGTKLGVPGLINAYKTAAAEALGAATIVEEQVKSPLNIKVNYALMGDVMNFIKSVGYEYEIPDMVEQFEVIIHIPFSEYDSVKNICIENSWITEKDEE